MSSQAAGRLAPSAFAVESPAPQLVINEVDYDQPGTDAAEFVEIYNAGSSAVDLNGKMLVLLNGSTSQSYQTVDLSSAGLLPGDGYLVVGAPGLAVPAGALKMDFGNAANNLQNGAPDGVALVDTNSQMLLDALSYEGEMTAVEIPGLPGTYNLVEGAALPMEVADDNAAPGALVRLPNGADTDDAATDWQFSNTPTPGAANVPTTYRIADFGLNPGNERWVDVDSDAAFYYILYRGPTVNSITQAVTMAGGTGATLSLIDASPLLAAAFYRLGIVPVAQPLDTDGDLMDDLFELRYPGCLDPLDPVDADADCDSDGQSNFEEYQAGTNPTRPPVTGVTLVINEVDYDQPGSDTDEFVEIFNADSSAVDLNGKTLVLVNGSNNQTYQTVDLSPAGTLAPGAYLVVGAATVTPAPGALKIDFASASSNVQNGSPDGMALVDTVGEVILDALSYEGGITAAAIAGLSGTHSLVEGTALPGNVADGSTVGSLARLPNGADSNDAATDWAFSSTPTPGAANVP